MDLTPWQPQSAGEEVVEMSREEFEALLGRAELLLSGGLFAQAALGYAALGVVAPTDPRVFAGMGQACHQQRLFGPALLAYDIAVELNPGDLAVQALRAECGILALDPPAGQQMLAAVLGMGTPDSRSRPYLLRLQRVAARHSVDGKAAGQPGTSHG